jgi:hypothetical protein
MVPSLSLRQGFRLAMAVIPVGPVVDFHQTENVGVEFVKKGPDALG